MQTANQSYLGIFISLFIHGLIWSLILLIPDSRSSQPLQLPVEVIYEDSRDPQERPLVSSVKLPEIFKTESKEAKANFKSEEEVRVKEESQARDLGQTKNSEPGMVRKPTLKSLTEIRKNKIGSKSINQNDPSSEVETAKSVQSFLPQRMNDSNSAIDWRLTGVKQGDFTALNTDQHLFYSFYNRVNEQIRWRWENAVIQAVENYNRRPSPNLPKRDRWVTIAEFHLNKQGDLVKILLEKSSGFNDLDQAAKIAFSEGAPIMNPPKEMIQDDGLVKIRYAFQVYWTPQLLARPLSQ
jgi:TonB family protein